MTSVDTSSTTNCSICLDPFSSPAACIPCGHVFCHLCISQWYSVNGGAHGMCPQCRTSITSIQALRIDDGNIYIHHASIAGRIVSFFYRQWFAFTGLIHEIVAELPRNRRELEEIAARYHLPNLTLAAHRLRRMPARALLSWISLGPELQFFSLVVTILVLSLFIKDLRNPVGLFQSCVFPILGLCEEILREILCCLLLLVCRPLICVGQCILEVILALWDIFLGVGACAVSVGISILTIPCVVVSAGVLWMSTFAVFVVETSIATLRLLFIMCLILIPGFFSQTTVEQRNMYFQHVIGVMHDIQDLYQANIARLQERYRNG